MAKLGEMKALFEELVELPPEQCPARLDKICAETTLALVLRGRETPDCE
jgi:hypothetical protein